MQFQTDREHVIFRKRLHRVSRIPIIQLVRVNVVGEDVAELSDGIALVVWLESLYSEDLVPLQLFYIDVPFYISFFYLPRFRDERHVTMFSSL